MKICQKYYGIVLLTTILLIIIFVLMPEYLLTRITDTFFQITGINNDQITAHKIPSIYNPK